MEFNPQDIKTTENKHTKKKRRSFLHLSEETLKEKKPINKYLTTDKEEKLYEEIRYFEVDIDQIKAFEGQGRKHFDQEELQGLADSIKEVGVSEPIKLVDKGDHYQVISGERRLRASKMAGLKKIPATIISDTVKAEKIALIENLKRQNLHPLELGNAFARLLEQKIYTSQKELAQAMGVKESKISESLNLTKIDEKTQEKLLVHNLKRRAFLRKLLKGPSHKMQDFIQKEIEFENGEKKALKEKVHKRPKKLLLGLYLQNDEIIINQALQDLDRPLKAQIKARLYHLAQSL